MGESKRCDRSGNWDMQNFLNHQKKLDFILNHIVVYEKVMKRFKQRTVAMIKF